MTISPRLNIYLVFVILSSFLTSCDILGIEVSTVKGEWVSEPYKNQYIVLNFSNNVYSYRTLHNDTIIKSGNGTWVLDGDTISLYRQDNNGDGIRRYQIEQMSMNNLTIRDLSDNDVLIMTRQYSSQNKDYDSQFEEVFDLKKGFWWYVVRGIQWIFGIGVILWVLYIILNAIEWVVNKVRKK